MILVDEFCNYTRLRKVDIIKFDSEDDEKGVMVAKEIITDLKTDLSIYLYHKETHLWDTFLMISSLNSTYEIYLGHHINYPYETILYTSIK